MDLMKIAAEMFMKKLGASGGDFDLSKVTSAIGGLLPTNNGELDLGGLVGMFSKGGLASLASSWLGDSSNSEVSTSQVASLFGENKISEFASALNLDTDTATQGLSNMLPDLIDKSSSGGELLDTAKGLLGKFF